MKYIIVVFMLLFLAACVKRDTNQPSTPETEYKIKKLFTHEGCTVYRFEYSGNGRYFTNCSGSTAWDESCGKNCTNHMTVN